MRNRLCLLFVCGAVATTVFSADPQPVFDSKIVSAKTSGHAVDVDVDLKGAKELYLVVRDGGDGFTAD